MNATSNPFFPRASSTPSTGRPLTASVRRKAGSGVPRGSIVDGVSAMSAPLCVAARILGRKSSAGTYIVPRSQGSGARFRPSPGSRPVVYWTRRGGGAHMAENAKVIVSLLTEKQEFQRLQAEDARATAARIGLDVQILWTESNPTAQVQQIYEAVNAPAGARPAAIVVQPAAAAGLEAA